jgi:hypothetical protein
MAAVISRALDDLGKKQGAIKTSPKVKDEAMAWINGPDCEAYCLVLEMDYATIRERGAALYRQYLEDADTRPIRRPKRRPAAGVKIANKC